MFPRFFTDGGRVCGIFRDTAYAARSNHPSKCELLRRAEPEESKRIVVTASMSLNCCQSDYKLAHVLRKATAEKCKGRHCELLHVKKAVAEDASRVCLSRRYQKCMMHM
ncbi:hypothetical protein M0804_013525 [Polistes exclamans]|nr:hypothetical protein M0804_013525 [Polistes exclamans]